MIICSKILITTATVTTTLQCDDDVKSNFSLVIAIQWWRKRIGGTMKVWGVALLCRFFIKSPNRTRPERESPWHSSAKLNISLCVLGLIVCKQRRQVRIIERGWLHLLDSFGCFLLKKQIKGMNADIYLKACSASGCQGRLAAVRPHTVGTSILICFVPSRWIVTGLCTWATSDRRSAPHHTRVLCPAFHLISLRLFHALSS